MSDSMQTAAVHACGVNVLMSEGVNADEKTFTKEPERGLGVA